MSRSAIACPAVLRILTSLCSLCMSTVQNHWLVRLGLLVFWLPLLNGCGVDFLWHVAVGQAKLLARRQPVEQVLEEAQLSPQEREKIRLILDVKAFAVAHLGLHADDSYTTYVDVGGPYVTYNVSAAPKDALQPYVWWFPIVGRMPYKGFFNKDRAVREARELDAQGYDTHVRGVGAYSTLGYFDDPILSSMLLYPDVTIMDTIIHELVHQTVWVKGSVSFNESLANFVGNQGTLAYLAWRYGSDAPEYQHYVDLRADGGVFREYMHALVERLQALYAQPLSRAEKIEHREQIFAEAKANYPQVLPRMKTTAYQGYFTHRTLNNAVLLSFRRYHRGTAFFDQILAAYHGDVRQMLSYFKTLRAEEIPAEFQTQ